MLSVQGENESTVERKECRNYMVWKGRDEERDEFGSKGHKRRGRRGDEK